MVDPLRIELVIANLLDNAVKFSSQGGTVAVALRQDDGGAIRLSVTDHGVGIPADQREAVFSRFHHTHGDRHLSGLGLGLYVSREIVNLHGGSVWIEEPEGGGTRVIVSLLPATVDRQVEPAAYTI